MFETSAAIPLREDALVELTGEDRLDWLQGQVTGDVSGLKPGARRAFCFVEPTGGLLAVIDAWALPDRILLSTARSRVPDLLGRIERMTILEDVSAKVADLQGVALLGSGAEQRAKVGGEHYRLPSDRFRHEGWEIWASSAEIDALAREIPPVGTSASEAFRLQAGIPRWDVDMGPKTLPPELGPDFEARHVSYDKGCYTGQEVLMRLHSRGHTNRTWVGLLSPIPLKVGDEALFGGKPVGRITSTADSPDWGPIAAAILRNEATQPGTRVAVGSEEAEVRPMPLLRTP